MSALNGQRRSFKSLTYEQRSFSKKKSALGEVGLPTRGLCAPTVAD